MLINCPRCGFQQPEDQYCAQCGVDMESFKPTTRPLHERILGNNILKFTTLGMAAVIAGAVLYNYFPGQSNTSASSASAPSAPVQITNTSSNSTAPASVDGQMEPVPADTQGQSTEAESQPIAAAAVANPATEAAATALNAAGVNSPETSPTPEASPSGAEKRAVASTSGSSLIVTYAEVPSQSLQSLIDATHSVPNGQFQSFTGYSAGVLPGLHDRMTAANFNMIVLHKETRNLSTLNAMKALQWFHGLKDPGTANDIGLTTFITLPEYDATDTSLRGTMEVQRGWREASPNGIDYQRRSFPAEFEITPRTGFFMTGVMPPRANIPNEDELTTIDVFKILRSAPFQRAESEFVIFVEFVRDSN